MDQNSPAPPQVMIMGGGAAMFIVSFFPFLSFEGEPENAWDAGFLSLPTLFPLLGLLLVLITAARAFGFVALPDSVAGFTMAQIVLALSGFTAIEALLFLFWNLGPGVTWSAGLYLTLLAAATTAVGAVQDLRAQDTSSAGTAPPQPF